MTTTTPHPLPIRLTCPAGAKVPYKIVERRAGDTVAVWAATEFAEKELGWKSKLGLTEMCRDQWAWAKKYPKVGNTKTGLCYWLLCVRCFLCASTLLCVDVLCHAHAKCGICCGWPPLCMSSPSDTACSHSQLEVPA